MRKIALLFISSLALAGCQQPAGGALNKVVAAGVPMKLDFWYSAHEDCTSTGPTVVRVAHAPDHGKVSIKPVADYPSFPAANPRHECNVKKIEGQQVWYSPDAGYTGPDSVALDIIFPNGNARQTSYSINVR